MTLTPPSFTLNHSAKLLVLALGIVLIAGGSAWIGYAAGTENGKQQAIENPPQRQSLNGEVKSVSGSGLTLHAQNEDWEVKYTENTRFTAGGSVGGTDGATEDFGKDDIKEGDSIRVIGVRDGDKKVIAQTISKSQPRQTASPGAGAPGAPRPPFNRPNPPQRPVPPGQAQ